MRVTSTLCCSKIAIAGSCDEIHAAHADGHCIRPANGQTSMIRIGRRRAAAALQPDEGGRDLPGAACPYHGRIGSRIVGRRAASGVEAYALRPRPRQKPRHVSRRGWPSCRLPRRDFPASHAFVRITVAPTCRAVLWSGCGSSAWSASAAAQFACPTLRAFPHRLGILCSMISGHKGHPSGLRPTKLTDPLPELLQIAIAGGRVTHIAVMNHRPGSSTLPVPSPT